MQVNMPYMKHIMGTSDPFDREKFLRSSATQLHRQINPTWCPRCAGGTFVSGARDLANRAHPQKPWRKVTLQIVGRKKTVRIKVISYSPYKWGEITPVCPFHFRPYIYGPLNSTYNGLVSRGSPCTGFCKTECFWFRVESVMSTEVGPFQISETYTVVKVDGATRQKVAICKGPWQINTWKLRPIYFPGGIFIGSKKMTHFIISPQFCWRNFQHVFWCHKTTGPENHDTL